MDQTDPTPTSPSRDVTRELDAIEVAMRKTRRAHDRPILLEGALWVLVALCACLVTGAGALLVFGEHAANVAGWIVVVGGGLTLVGAAAAWAWWARSGRDELSTARLLQTHTPRWRDDLTSALHFGRDLRDGAFDEGLASAALARAHVRRAAKKVQGALEHGHLAHDLPARDLKPAASALGGALALLMIPAGLIALQGDESALAPAAAMLEAPTPKRPVVGNLSLTLQPPPYTKLESTYEPFTSGNVEVLSGTEITIQAYALMGTTRQVELLLTPLTSPDDEEPTAQTRVMSLSNSGRAQTSFVVTEPMAYTFRAQLEDGSIVEESVERRIDVRPDQAPSVEILSHDGVVQVSSEDILELEFAVEDDFGITGVTRVHIFGVSPDQTERLDLESAALQGAPTSHNGEHTLDLSTLGLQPKDRVTLYLEATDNNTLTGPGVGQSNTLELVVASPDDKHIQNIAAQREIAEELLDSLADFLEAPVGDRVTTKDGSWRQVVPKGVDPVAFGQRRDAVFVAHERHGEILERMGELAGQLGEDPMMAPRDLKMFAALYDQLLALHERGDRLRLRSLDAASGEPVPHDVAQGVGSWAGETEEALEKGMLRLLDLLFSQQLASAEATAAEIQELRERLRELLEKYKETGDPELKEAIKREIQRLRQRMQELMQRMNTQMQQLPQEHVNREAIQQAQLESDARKMADDFQSIEDLLDKGDIDGALEALDAMGEQLDQMTEQMSSQFEGAQPQGLSEFDEQVGELMDDVNDLSELQKQVEEQTRELQEQMQAEQKAASDEMLEQATKELLEQIAQQKRALDELERQPLPSHMQASMQQSRDSLERLEESLELKDVESSIEKAKRSLEDIESMRFSMQLSQRYKERDSAEGKKVRDALRKTRPMVRRGQEVVDDLEALMQQAEAQDAQPNPRAQELAEQQQQVGEQAQKLSERIGEASEKFPSLEKDLKPSMQRTQESMQQAQEGLERQRPQRALDAERQALEELRQMNESMKEALQRKRNEEQRQGQGQEQSTEEVIIPERDNTRGGVRFGEDVKKTMKEERLDEYSDAIGDYYKSLSE